LGPDNREPSARNDGDDLLALRKETTDVEKGPDHSANPAQSVEDAVEETPAAADPNIVTWDGPDDPYNPYNWPTRKKIFNVSTISAVTFLTYGFSLPCLDTVEKGSNF
jgi:hypothetical protein